MYFHVEWNILNYNLNMVTYKLMIVNYYASNVLKIEPLNFLQINSYFEPAYIKVQL